MTVMSRQIRPTTEIFDLTPPHDHQAELSVLASILLDPTLLGQAPLTASDFYGPECQKIYRTMLACQAAGTPIDVTLLVPQLVKDHGESGSDWNAHLAGILQSQLTPANYQYYADRVSELS